MAARTARSGPTGKGSLVDRFGRNVTYLRLSVTDRCDFRCQYCMAKQTSFLPRAQVLTLEECLRVTRVFVELGINKVRVTGGEPLVRRDVLWLLERIAALPGVGELVLTSNGSQLERLAVALRQAGVRRLNLSLDTLRAERFQAITRVGQLSRVLRGLAAAQAAGFERIRLNTVLIRGGNDDELSDLVAFAIDRRIDIAFIEEMPLGDPGDRRRSGHLGSDEALARLRENFALIPSAETTGGPARYWRIPGSPMRVGFISPHSDNFCDCCNRVRVTARGDFHPCLGQDAVIQLLPLLRAHPADDRPLREAIVAALGLKARGHDFAAQDGAARVGHFMSMTGG
ncbi:GTP 3',8-cyclase MoaA [Accumulibacter sp.]|uniref:GTP 3',8-cyclase MoaA n=1 Tax=Accumulibacter sp. TaxID=2053492 RepID=UPI0025F7276D|nr:GTP 3',8-cyclase MoaA [Accumulibacter sp.]MCM8595553.1 GTP 3',8-cyclase MoaA [Accumulibacter sp.]MDS4049701.1 GTP 3',8-cyclase MoaA [Accumulibacter sp.]